MTTLQDVLAFLAVLAVLVFLRLVLRRNGGTTWKRYRVGVYVERDPSEREVK